MLLEVESLTVGYGRVTAVRDLALEVAEGDTIAILGPNGAGKSTLLSAIMGQVRPSAGAIRLDGKSILGVRTDEIVRRGVALVPEGRHIFTKLSVEENLQLGAMLIPDKALAASRVEEVLELLPALRPLLPAPAGRLSGGEQQQLAIGRALIGDPRLLMLDEPSLGLAPIVMDRVFETLVRLRSQNVTILLVEQAVSRALAIADRVYVLRNGRCHLSGAADEVGDRATVAAVYMGSEAE
jgi:branched-chain amino acid transport system ATP-binding protein